MDEWLRSLDPVRLEAERFSLTPEAARALLTPTGKVRKRKMVLPPPRFAPQPVMKRKSQVLRESLYARLNLSEAQKRAVWNYWKGLENGN